MHGKYVHLGAIEFGQKKAGIFVFLEYLKVVAYDYVLWLANTQIRNHIGSIIGGLT